MLSHRFLQTIKPFDWYLKLFGIIMKPATNPRWRLWLTNLWSLFWIVLVLQAGTCIFIWRGLSALPNLFYSEEYADRQGHSRMEDLNDFIFGAYPLSFDALIYVCLVLSLRETARLLLSTLEPVDAQLRRPNLKVLRQYCNVGIIWMASTVTI